MVKPVNEEPHVRLERWGVMLDPFGYRLVGLKDGMGRVTSPIVVWNGHDQTAETASGRQYRLVGAPDPIAAKILIAAHAMKWGADPNAVATVSVDEMEAAVGPRPGMKLN